MSDLLKHFLGQQLPGLLKFILGPKISDLTKQVLISLIESLILHYQSWNLICNALLEQLFLAYIVFCLNIKTIIWILSWDCVFKHLLMSRLRLFGWLMTLSLGLFVSLLNYDKCNNYGSRFHLTFACMLWTVMYTIFIVI